MEAARAESTPLVTTAPPALGTYGHLAIFAWLLGLSMLAPIDRLPVTMGLCGLVALVVYPGALRRILRPRYLVWMLLLVLPTLFLPGGARRDLGRGALLLGGNCWRRPRSPCAKCGAGRRAGFTGAVEITALAGMLEASGCTAWVLAGRGAQPAAQPSAIQHSRLARPADARRTAPPAWRGLQLLVIPS
jgi:hypothetical protein